MLLSLLLVVSLQIWHTLHNLHIRYPSLLALILEDFSLRLHGFVRGGERLKGSWCFKYGMCSWDRAGGVEPSWDVDDVGLLCDRCSILEQPFRWPNSGQYCAVWLVKNRIFPMVSATPGGGKLLADHLAKTFQSEAWTDREKHHAKQGTHVLCVDFEEKL